MIDLHCHILHGLDDGARSLDEAAEMAKAASKGGIQTIVATPHLYRGDEVPKNLNIIRKKCDELRYVLSKNHVDVEIVQGAEVHVSHNLVDEIRKNKKKLFLNSSSYMFLEFPSGHVFSGVKDLLFDLMSDGIRPIIAHPERNAVFVRHPSLLYELVQMGVLAQANSGSFIGLYGSRVEEAAFRFLELNLLHFMASDAHNPRPPSLWLQEAADAVEERFGKDVVSALVNDNPHAVLEDEELPYLPRPLDPSQQKRSIRIKLPRFFKK
ncbi:MAG: tyrosine-protein phosphatase [Candidatus Aminicenantales bacterium]